MAQFIRVYLFDDIKNYILKTTHLISDIEDYTNTRIHYEQRRDNSYFEIEGEHEMIHKTRIILQDIEKSLYETSYTK